MAREKTVSGRVQLQAWYLEERRELVEQLAREKTVSGRVQLQAWYLEERRELVVSVLAADDLAPREDTGYGSQPEAYVRECTVELQKAFLEDRSVWYRLEDPRQLRHSKSPLVSPRGSLANPGAAAREIAQRLLRRGDFQQQRSFSEELVPINYSRERRRSSSARGNTHYEPLGREELLRGLKADLPTGTRTELSRTLSMSQEKRPAR
ncbi:hypothetical protein B566_EDAN005183, partial [Ephemera danica]